MAGMAYLVRRLLENTSNESFLYEQARGVPLEELLAAPREAFANEPILECDADRSGPSLRERSRPSTQSR